MRSRFDAFRRGDAQWLIATWHSSTRPAHLDLSGNPRWRTLQIVDVTAGGEDDDHGVVEFRASFIADGEHGVLHERSRFVRDGGRWVYLDGDVSGGDGDVRGRVGEPHPKDR